MIVNTKRQMSESERARSLRSTGAAGVSSEYKLAIAKPAVVTKAHPKLAACTTGAEPIDCTGTEVERPVVTGACSNKDHLARRTRCRHVRATSWANDESLSSSSVATLLSRSGSQHSSKAGAPEARSVSSKSRPACKRHVTKRERDASLARCQLEVLARVASDSRRGANGRMGCRPYP